QAVGGRRRARIPRLRYVAPVPGLQQLRRASGLQLRPGVCPDGRPLERSASEHLGSRRTPGRAEARPPVTARSLANAGTILRWFSSSTIGARLSPVRTAPSATASPLSAGVTE